MTDASGQPLAGLRVVDMTSLAMGPLATQILGDYGADVVKVESPAGDPFRAALHHDDKTTGGGSKTCGR